MTSQQQTLCIGLTGGIGSGKSTVAALFQQLGARIIDTDLIAHQLTEANGIAMPDILQHFGARYLTANGALNRNEMRELIFTTPAAKQQLEAILHPLILQHTHRQLAQATLASYTVLVVPLLLQSPEFLKLVQRVIVVDCDEEKQIQRVKKRSHLNSATIKNIIQQQTSRSERLARADDLLHNQGEVDELAVQVAALHKIYAQNN